MKNPYKILDISQDATSQEIIRAVPLAMKSRKYSTREIAKARASLSKPAIRLAADFTLPIFPQRTEISIIKPFIKSTGVSIDKLDPNKYNSL